MKYFVLILGWIIAVLMLKYRSHLRRLVGDVAFAERFFGSGGTNTFIVFLAILVFVLSLMYAMGTLQGVVTSTVGRFF